MGYLRRFAAFWYDFLVGDRWELFVGPIVALALGAILVGAHLPAAGVGAVLFLLIVGIGALSIGLAIL